MSEYNPQSTGILLSNTETIPGYQITEVLGLAMGNTVRAKHIGKDIGAGLKSLVGGELKAYTEMLSDARREATNRMINDGKGMGAHAIVNIRYMTSSIMSTAAELFAYGTAVRLMEK
jgi:uncharacterized protein YbjQ (UPF0145 family)